MNAFAQERLGADNRVSLVYVPREGEEEPVPAADLAAMMAQGDMA